jgi:hypothetical protein
MWWAWLDLNQRPHPYQQSRAHRYATLRFCWLLPTVEGEVMRSSNLIRTDGWTRCYDGGKVCRQPVARKVMGLPGGRGSPIERRDRDGDQAA